MKKVSIIVPVHNAEAHLQECLSSIENQTLKEIEIICVDDASQDNSSNIIKRFVEHDSRFVLLQNEECAGAGNTRNKGMKQAQGMYVVFWDSDEIYNPSLLEKMYDSALKFDADVVLAERGILNPENGEVSPEASHKYQDEGYSKKSFRVADLPDYGLGIWPSSPINRMVRKALLDEYDIQFQDLRSSNDVYYADMSSIVANRIIHIDDWNPMIYVRRDLPGSISSNRDPFCSYKAFKKIKDDLIRLGKWETYHRYVCMHYASAIFVELRKCKNAEKLKEYFFFTREEGFHNICEKADYGYMVYESKFSNQLNLLLHADFRIRCWESNYRLRQSLYENMERLRNVFRYFEAYNKQVALWECGDWTEEIQSFVKDNYKFEFNCIINNWKNFEDIDVLMVANKADYRIVGSQIGNITKHFEVFALYEYLDCPSLDRCVKSLNNLDLAATSHEVFYNTDEINSQLTDEIDIQLAENYERLKDIFQIINRIGARVGIWEENEWTKKIIQYARCNFEFEFHYIVKANDEIHDSKLLEVPMVSISSIRNEIDLIFVSSPLFMDAVCKRVVEENYKIQLFKLYEFLKGYKIDNCIKSLMLSLDQRRNNKAFERVSRRIKENSTKLRELFQVFEGKRVGLWGAGIWGHELTRYLEQNNVFKLYGIIDNNQVLIGCNINGTIVYDFESIYKELDIIIVANRGFYEEIFNQVKSYESEILIFELYRYLLDEDLNNCFS